MEADEQKTERKAPTWPVRWLVALVIAGGLVAFAWTNGQPVPVRPFGKLPLNQIMAAPLLVGIILGWLVRSRIAARAARGAARAAARQAADKS